VDNGTGVMQRRTSVAVWGLGLFLMSVASLSAQAGAVATSDLRFPGAEWLRYQDVAEAGFSPGGLSRAREYWERRGSPALMIVVDGAVVDAWGEVDRRFPIHSIRKSLLSALYGAYPTRIDLDATLAELGIGERTPLTATESGATVRDVLTSSSGVYLPAVGEAADAANARPARGSRQPGEAWWYNNWDFNVAGTIFEQRTGEGILPAFSAAIAAPLEMEDWRSDDGFQYSDPAVSEHAGFGARMSTRDLARFGWLYVASGEWRGTPVIPGTWVEESTRGIVEADLDPDLGDSYGYMWWVDEAGYYARGYGGHVVAVYPQERMVVVVRADTYHERFLSNRSIRILLERIREARTSEPVASPQLAPLEVDRSAEPAAQAEPTWRWRDHLGELSLPRSGVTVRIAEVDGRPVLDFGEGTFELRPLSAGRFLAIESRDTVIVRLDSDGSIDRVLSEPVVYLEAAAAARDGEVDEAIEWVSVAVDAFPESVGPRLNMARALLGIGDRAGARAQLDTAAIIDPTHPGIVRLEGALGVRRFLPLAAVVVVLLMVAIAWRRRSGEQS
jgi:CubicO group peptidase (beta-lactamase class C family)